MKVILYALLLTPLWVWSVFLFPFITTKILYLRLLVELALVIYIPLAFKYPELRPRWNWLTKMVLIYFGIVLVTSITGVNFFKSFCGTIEPRHGIVTMLHFLAYFLMLPAVFRSKKDWYWYLFSAVTVTAISGLYGVAQLLNLPIVVQPGIARVSSTIGNASFFGAFMLFGMFLSWHLARETKSAWQKWYLYGVFAFELVILYQTQTRGALLGAVAAFGIYFLLNLWRSPKRKVKIASVAFLVLLILAGVGVYAGRNSNFIRSHNTLARLATISRSDITTQSRLDTWNASWKGWKDRFVLGYGYENYNIAFNKYFPARIFKDQGSQVWFDRAHNIFFDVAVTSGIFGLLAYLGIFAAALITLFKLFRSPKYGNSQNLVILGVLLVAYFFQNLFVFDTQATYLMFFIVLAYIVHLEHEYLATAQKSARVLDWGYLPPVAVAIVMVVAAYFLNWKPAMANYHTTIGIKLSRGGQYRQVMDSFKTALSYGTYMDEEIRQKLVDFVNEGAASGTLTAAEKKEYYNFVIAELRKSIARSRRDVKNYLYLMSVHSTSSGSADEALALGQRALELSPTRPQIYYEMGQAAFLKNDPDTGLEYFRKGVELNPEPKESHFNYLLAAIIAKKPDLARQEIDEITKRGYSFDANNYVSLARAYFQTGDKQQAIAFYKQALALSPGNIDLHARLAAIYGDLCDLASAKAEVDAAVSLDSRFAQEGREFLAEVAQKCKK